MFSARVSTVAAALALMAAPHGEEPPGERHGKSSRPWSATT